MSNWKFVVMWFVSNWQLIIITISFLYILHKLSLLKSRERELFTEMMEREREWNQVIKRISKLYDRKIFLNKTIKDDELEKIQNLVDDIETEREDRISIENYDFIYDLNSKIDEFKKEYPNFFK